MLNKVARLGLIVISVLALTACGEASVREIENDGSARFKGIDGDIKIITDSDTGCKYVFIKNGVSNTRTEAFSPLLKNKDEFDCGQ